MPETISKHRATTNPSSPQKNVTLAKAGEETQDLGKPLANICQILRIEREFYPQVWGVKHSVYVDLET